jgi:transposase
MDTSDLENQLRQRDQLIELMAETIRRQQQILAEQAQEIARLQGRVAGLERVLERKAQANRSKTPRFSGDYSLRSQERPTRRRKRRSPGRRPKALKLDRTERTEEVYPEGVPPQQCVFGRDRLAWRIEDGRAVRVRYRLHRDSHSGRMAELPEVLPRSEHGLEVAVILAFLVYSMGLSIDKARALLSFFCRLDLSKSQADSLLSQLSRLWQRDFEALCELMAWATVIYIDETGWKLSAANCYAWVFTTLTHTVLLYGRGRDHSVLEEILPEDFGGIGVSDDYAVYRDRFGRGQKCWAHLLRKAIALMLAHPENSTYRQFFERLLALFRGGKRFQHDRRLGPSGRERRVVELEEGLERLCTRWQDELSEETPTDERDFVNLQKALMRMKQEKELFTFVLVPEVEATNNRSERTLRFTAQMRQANQTSKSEWGAQRRSILTSVLLSLRQHLPKFTLDGVVREVTRWRRAGASLFRAQLAALRAGLPPPEVPAVAQPG